MRLLLASPPAKHVWEPEKILLVDANDRNRGVSPVAVRPEPERTADVRPVQQEQVFMPQPVICRARNERIGTGRGTPEGGVFDALAMP